MAQASTIGASTVVRGNLRGDGDVEIHGRVEGSVSMSGDVTLGEHAAVLGDITGAVLVLGGAVQGDVRGTDSVVLDATARVVGDIGAPRIGITDGALVRGNVQTDGESMSAAPRARTAARAEPARRVDTAPARQEEKKAEARPAPARKPAAPAKKAVAKAPPPKAKPAPPAKRTPPPPVVPALRRGTRAKKKTRRH